VTEVRPENAGLEPKERRYLDVVALFQERSEASFHQGSLLVHLSLVRSLSWVISDLVIA
jgi:hypothetical protein